MVCYSDAVQLKQDYSKSGKRKNHGHKGLGKSITVTRDGHLYVNFRYESIAVYSFATVFQEPVRVERTIRNRCPWVQDPKQQFVIIRTE